MIFGTIKKIYFICSILCLDCKKQCGPGYKSPLDAFINGKRETILYTICIQPNALTKKKSDYLATIDVNPDSPTYSQVIIYFILLQCFLMLNKYYL
jgi:hypothetical protein